MFEAIGDRREETRACRTVEGVKVARLAGDDDDTATTGAGESTGIAGDVRLSSNVPANPEDTGFDGFGGSAVGMRGTSGEKSELSASSLTFQSVASPWAADCANGASEVADLGDGDEAAGLEAVEVKVDSAIFVTFPMADGSECSGIAKRGTSSLISADP